MDLQERLDQLVVAHRVPGAVVGVLAGDDLTVRAAGLTRLPGGPPVTPYTVFLIASITKVWTATLVMQLVDSGEVKLDEPANSYLDPPLRLEDAAVADSVTVRQLLTHSGGFYGDADEPPDRGDDAVERIVAGYASLPQLHRPGTLFSYSNAGFNVLGRLVECRTGGTWDTALRERLLEPLELKRTFTLPEEAMVHPFAVGHDLVSPDSLDLEPVSCWIDGRGSGPCGGTLSTSAADLLSFARMHIRDGAGPRGQRVLSAGSARAMREAQIAQPDPGLSPAWGLGWAIERLGDPLVIGHGGNTRGQHSELVVVPEHDLALCVLTNGDTQGLLRRDLVSGLLKELVGVEAPDTPPPAAPGAPAPDPARFVGRYGRSANGAEDVFIDVTESGGELRAAITTPDAPNRTASLSYAVGTSYLVTVPPLTVPVTATFVFEDPAADVASHLAVGLRVLPRR